MWETPKATTTHENVGETRRLIMHIKGKLTGAATGAEINKYGKFDCEPPKDTYLMTNKGTTTFSYGEFYGPAGFRIHGIRWWKLMAA